MTSTNQARPKTMAIEAISVCCWFAGTNATDVFLLETVQWKAFSF